MFRSSYAPVKDVIDGDLCEIFPTLDLSKQRVLAEELNRNPNEVNKKLEQARLKLLWINLLNNYYKWWKPRFFRCSAMRQTSLI